MWTNDPVYDAERYSNEQERKMFRFPICDACGQPITEESCWKVGGKFYHMDCAEEMFRVWTDEFVEDIA